VHSEDVYRWTPDLNLLRVKAAPRLIGRSVFRFALRHPIPLPQIARQGIRWMLRSYFHRRRILRHDSKPHFGPLALMIVHETLVRSHPHDFEVYGGRLPFRSAGSQMAMHGYYVGEFEFHLLRFLVDQLQPDILILDIGAHHGEFAVPLGYEIKARGWTSQVWSFEPDPLNLEFLHHNLDANELGAQVVVYPVAVSDQSLSSAELLCPVDNSGNTLRTNGSFALGPESLTAQTAMVSVIAIDDLEFGDKRVGIIKMDIQGSEPDALLGAATLIERDRPVIVVEVVAEWPRVGEVRNLLIRFGYTIWGLAADGRVLPIEAPEVFVSWDWIALPPNHPASASAVGIS
jgi:FkbM family methyltransferase